MAQFVTHIQPTLIEASHHHVPHLASHSKEHSKEHEGHGHQKEGHHKEGHHHGDHHHHDDDGGNKRDSCQSYTDSHGIAHSFQLHFVDSQGIYRDCHGHAIDTSQKRSREPSPYKESKPIPPQFIDLHGHLDNKASDGNTSFLRAARNGQLDKVLEHLKSNIDINTSNANGLNALHLASKDGHVAIVSELLKRGAAVDAATKKGNTALHIASLAGQEEVVRLLVAHGASVNVQSQNGFTPLYMAAQENHDRVVRYLLANGANQALSTEDGFTPLAVAMQQGHEKVVTVLLENDSRGKVRLPALHIAAKKDDVKAAKLLLENDHNPDVTSKSGFTPLHIASHYGNQAIANLLVQKGADVNYAAKHNITPLHVAAKWGKSNMVTVLLEQGATIDAKTRDGLTPLHCAARSGHEQVVDMLLDKGAPISSKTKNGLAPLHMAAQGDHVDAARILLYHRAPVDEVTVDYLTALHVAAHCGHVRVAKLLLDRQADANARALNGFTPLHIACKKNRIKVVELLLKHGASIGATTESGLTPLHVASFMGCMNIVIYLLQHEASPDAPTVRGETPLHLAARANQTDIIRILLRNGAQVDARAREQQTPLHIAARLGNVDIVMLLLQHGAKVDTATKDLYTALHIAAKEGQEDVAAALIENGASVTATTKKGFTPLHLAAKYGHLKVAKLLLQKEAPVDPQGKNGVTPLHVASHYDHQNVALLLLEKGASPYATAKNGHTPLHIAAKKNQMDIANTLLEYGAKPNAESKAGFTPLHLSGQEGHSDLSELLIEHKADPNYNSKNGLTPLHLCAQEDKVPVAEILVKNGAKIDAETKNGYTPLHIASHYGQVNMVKFLLKQGADVKAKTALGYSPLHQAAQQGHTGIVNMLLENGAQPNVQTSSGQTPLDIAQKLGYITVIDTLKVVTEPSSPQQSDEKYRVVAPEAMQETFMSDSEEEGGEDTVLAGDQTYRYLTADEMKSLGDDSLPIDVTRDERIDSNKFVNENSLPPRNIEDPISPEHIHQNYVEYIKKYTPDNVDINRHPINIGFLVSFLVDARGGAMRGCRHSGVRVIVPPRCASSPTRITCRYVRPQRTPHPPPLMEGEALASRVLELGPVGAKFLGPVIIEVPHFAALRGKEREIVILRSDNGETWKEHTIDATEEILNDVLHDSFEAEDLNQLEDVSSGRITRIITQDFPQYFAVVSRVKQEVHAIGPEGGMVSSTVVPQVQAVFPQGALTKKIKVGLQAQPIDPELTAKLLGHGVAVSPVVTVEPRRRKFHKAITLSMPTPRAHSQGMINQYSGNAPTLRLLCSITGGTTRAQWEDVTGSTPLTFVNDCVSFTTTVSARFWLMDCRNVGDATKMATELYREAIHVPFMAKFVVFAKRVDPLEARLRVFCMTDDKEDKTLEHQEHFTEVAKSRDVEVLENKPQYIEFAGNLIPITKSGEQLQFSFRAFRENRLPFSVRVKDQHAEAVGRALFMRETKQPKGEPPQQPICILNIVLPDDIVVDTISLTDSYTDSSRKLDSYDYYRPDPRLADVSNLLGDDWVRLATQLGLTTSEINVIKSEYPESTAKQAQSMLRMWLSQSGNKAQTETLELALRRIGRDDIVPHCLNEPTISTKPKLSRIPSSEGLKEKYLAEEKVFEEDKSEEEDFNRSVVERRQLIEQKLERAVPASAQRVEIVQEITSIKRQSLVENKIAEVESARRDSELLEGVTEAIRKTSIPKTTPKDDLKSPKFSKTPPPSPADFITKEQSAAIPEWDVSRKSTTEGAEPTAPIEVDAEQDGQPSTTTVDLEATTSINDKKLNDNKNNANEKKKTKKGFFGSIKTLVERSFESDSSDTEKSPKKTKLKKEKKKKQRDAKQEIAKLEFPTPSLDIQDPDIEFVDVPPSHKLPSSEETNEFIEQEDDSPILPRKKRESTPILIEQITTTIDPFVIESEEFSIIVDPMRQEKPKKSREILTINIDKSIEAIEKELLEKSPILSEEKILKPIAMLSFDSEPLKMQEHDYEDIEPVVSMPPPNLDALQQKGVKFTVEEPQIPEDIVEKQDREMLKEREESGKKKGGFFGLFKKRDSKKDDDVQEKKMSEQVIKDMEDTKYFIETEVDNYEDSLRDPPKRLEEQYAQISKQLEKEIPEKTVEEPSVKEEADEILSPKSSPSFFGRFKKSKKEPEPEQIVADSKVSSISDKVMQDIQDSSQFLSVEVTHYQDVKEILPTVEEPSVEKHSEEASSGFFGLFKKSKKDEDQLEEPKIIKGAEEKESSPKPSGFLGLFKKPKRDDEEPKMISENLLDSKTFLGKEIHHYEDVKPVEHPVENIKEPIPAKVSSSPGQGSPEMLTGVAEAGKDAEELSRTVPKVKQVIFAPDVFKDMKDTESFLKGEVGRFEDVRPVIPDPTTVAEEIAVETSKPTKGLFGIFKKTSKEEKPQIASDIETTEIVKTLDEDSSTESPKPSRGIFGMFKKSKDEVPETKTISQAASNDIEGGKNFVAGEVRLEPDIKSNIDLDASEAAAKLEGVQRKEEKSQLKSVQFVEKQKEIDKTLVSLTERFDDVIHVESTGFDKAVPLLKSTRNDIDDSRNFLKDEIDRYHDTREIVDFVHDLKISKTTQDHSPEPNKQTSKVEKKPPTVQENDLTTDERERDPAKPPKGTVPLAGAVLEDIENSQKFLHSEVENYHDVKPEVQTIEVTKSESEKKEESPKRHGGFFGMFTKPKDETHEVIEETSDTIREASPKRGILGIFKKSKEDPSEDNKKAIEDSQLFLQEEVVRYQDAVRVSERPSEEPSERKVGFFGIFKKSHEGTPEKVATDNLESSAISSRESTPKRGILSVFQKSKDETEPTQVTETFTETTHHLVESFQPLLKEETIRETSPKRHSGLFGALKLSKEGSEEGPQEAQSEDSSEPSKRHSGLFGLFKKREASEPKTVIVSEEAIKQIEDSKHFLKTEVEEYHDAHAGALQKAIDETSEEAKDSPKASHGIFGMFKKSTTESIGEETVRIENKLKEEEDTQASPKPSRGLFGLFKGEKEEKQVEVNVVPLENVVDSIKDSENFLNKEVENYEDSKPKVEIKPIEVIIKEESVKVSEVGSSPKPSRGLFGIFKKSKETDDEPKSADSVLEETLPTAIEGETSSFPERLDTESKTEILEVEGKPALSEEAILEMNETRQFLMDEVGNYNQGKPKPDTIEKEEPKQGFLQKFKKTKKKFGVHGQQFSVEIFNDMEDTKNFLRSEVEHYDYVPYPLTKEDLQDRLGTSEEVSTSDDAKSMVTVVEVTPPFLEKQVEVQTEQETKDTTTEETKKPKKDKKGFFNIFGKKSKSTEVTQPEQKTDDVVKKPKHKKSGSPFKFFDKSRKSEEMEIKTDIKSPEETLLQTKPVDEELLAVEFEEQPAIGLSEEVLQSFERKIEEMKKNYSDEAVRDINDCRDFLFIEKDSYEDSKPIIITDLDGDWSEETIPQTTLITDLDDPVHSTERGFFPNLQNIILDTKDKIEETQSKVSEDFTSNTDTANAVIQEKVDAIKKTVSETEEKIENVHKVDLQDLNKSGTEFVSDIDGLFGSVKDRSGHKIDEVSKSIAEHASGAAESIKAVGVTVADSQFPDKMSSEDFKIPSFDRISEVAETHVEDIGKQGLATINEVTNSVEVKSGKIEEVIGKELPNLMKEKFTIAADNLSEIKKEAEAKADEVVKYTESEVKDSTSKVIDKISERKQEILEAEELQNIKEHAVEVVDNAKRQADEALKSAERKREEIKESASKSFDNKLTSFQESLSGIEENAKRQIEEAVQITEAQIEKSKPCVSVAADTISEQKQACQDLTEKKLESTKYHMSELEEGVKGEINEIMEKAEEQVDTSQVSVSNIISQVGDEKTKLFDSITDKFVSTKEQVQEIKKHVEQKVGEAVTNSEQNIEKVKDSSSNGFDKQFDSSVDFIKDIQEDAKRLDIAEEYKRQANEVVEKIEEKLGASKDFPTSAQKPSLPSGKKTEDTNEGMLEISGQMIQGLDKVVLGTEQKIQESQEQVLRTIDATKKAVSRADENIRGKELEVEAGVQKIVSGVEAEIEGTTDNVTNNLRTQVSAIGSNVVKDHTETIEKSLKDLPSAIEEITSPGLSTMRESARDTEKKLEQLRAEATEKLDKLTGGYVTSPTAARRADSYRYSSEERPAFREVTTSQHSTEDEEEAYIVSEPDEIEEHPARKALFHLESEEDDSAQESPKKERRDSVKSNVLETLSGNNLDTLLTSLETQLVRDLEDSVLGVKVETDIASKKAQVEEELETFKKESESDVEEIEKKLKDLDEALGTLEKNDENIEKKLHRVERKFERMASESKSPTEPNEKEFQRLVSQMSTEEVSDFQKEYGHLWDETTFTKSDELDSSKTPDSLVDELSQESACLTQEEPKPQPKPRFAKEFDKPKPEKQISPVRDDLLDEEIPGTYMDKKKFWENRLSLQEIDVKQPEPLTAKKRSSIHEVPVPKPRGGSSTIAQTLKEEDCTVMSEYQAQFQPPYKPPSAEVSSDSETESERQANSSNDAGGYISDSGDVEHYISDSEIEDRVPQIRERQMSVFATPVAAARKTTYERSASLPTEDLYEVSARSSKLRKQYYEDQIKKEMIEEQLTSEIEEVPSPERKNLISRQFESQTSHDSSISDQDKVQNSKIDSMEVLVDKSEIEDSEKLEFEQDATDIETKSIDSYNAAEIKSDDYIPEITVTLSGLQRRISEESDEYAPKTNTAEERIEATVWETPVQVQAFDRVDDEISISAKDESEAISEIHQDSSSLSDKIKSESQSDIERIILDSLQHQKVDPEEAKTIASQLISEIETEIQKREVESSGTNPDYLKYLAETKGLDEREVQLVESVLARRERELAKLSRCDTSSIEITDEDLKYSGNEFDHSHLLEQQISQLKAEKIDDFERKEYETYKDYESTLDGTSTSIKCDQYFRTEDSNRAERNEKKDTIMEEDETISETSCYQKEEQSHSTAGLESHTEMTDERKIVIEDKFCINEDTSVISNQLTKTIANEESEIIEELAESIAKDFAQSDIQHEMATITPHAERLDTITMNDLSEKEDSMMTSTVNEISKIPEGELVSKSETISKKSSSTSDQTVVSEITEEKSPDSFKISKTTTEVKATTHEDISRTSSSESSGKSPDDFYSSCSSGRKGDSDTSKVVPLRKRSNVPKGDRKSGLEFEYSSSGESHYHSFEIDSGKSRPCSSDIEGLLPAGSSEYESAVTSQSHTEYHTAVSSLSSKESMKSLDSESSGHLGSVEVSELSETLVPSTSDLEDEENAWDDSTTESKMKRSYEMTFQPEPKILSTESPQVEEPSMSVSSTTEPRTVIELSLTDSEKMSGSNISDQLSIEGSYDSLIFKNETGTTTGNVEGSTIIDSISITTSTGSDQTRHANTQVTSEPEIKKKGHRRQESTSYIPTHSELTESDKYYATEMSLKEVTSDEKKDVDESCETEADQGLFRAMREEKYHSPDRKKSTSNSKSGSTSSSFEEAEAEAAFNMVAHVSPAHKISQICPILEDEDAEKHELETRERAQKEFERRKALLRDQSPGSIPDIKVTQHMTPLVDRNFHYPDLELEEAERLMQEKEKEKEESSAQTPSSKSSEDTDQGREYVLEDSGISIPEEPTESQSTVLEKTAHEEREKDTTESENSDSFEMLEKPDLIDDFVVIEEVAREAQEFDSEGKSVKIDAKPKTKKKHDDEVEALITKSEPTPPKTRMTDLKYFPETTVGGEDLGFEFEDSPPINSTTETGSNYDKELEANKQWIEQQFQGDKAARMAAGYDYEMEFERGPLEDIKEEDINDFDPTSSRIGSVGSQKESGGSLGSVKDSYSSTPEYDVLAGRKYFTRSGDHDDVSMSSLQEFESLEKAMSLEARRTLHGSQDSPSNGNFKTRYYQSKGQGDDVSVSSLKEFEGIEMAIQAAHKVEVKAKEEEANLGQIEEGQESLASESEEAVKKPVADSDEEEYEKRLFEIDEIIKQAQTNVERFIDLREGEKTESLGRGDSIEEVARVPDLDLDTPLGKNIIKVQWKDPTDCMVTSVDSIDAMQVKHDSSADSLDQKALPEVMTASTDSIEFERAKKQTSNISSDSIDLKDEACGIVTSDSLELPKAEMLESTDDSLVDPTSSNATHATYQYESDSIFSGSMTSGGSNTMVSSTDTIDPVQVDLEAAVRKVYFDESTSGGYTSEMLPNTGKPYVTEVIEPCDDERYSHTIHRRVELPPEVRKVTFYGSDADERLKQFIEDFGEGENIDEFEEVDADGNVHTKQVVQKRYVVSSLPNQTNQGKDDGGAPSHSQQVQETPLKAQASRRRPLRYDISLDDQIEVDPREHDWRFNLPEHAEGEEQSGSQHDQRPVADQHQLSDEMKQLLRDLEEESKQ